MLTSLSITNIVLIDELLIDFKEGLCVLTGETGAGKSILLDALGLALGARVEPGLLRQGASKAQISASFSLPETHPLWEELEEQGISYENGEVIFRRLLEENGKNKCFLNDQVISQTLMRRLGQALVEIHGQFDQLLDSKSHFAALDAYGKIDKYPVQEAFLHYQEAKSALKTFQENLNKSLERQTFLRFSIDEIEKIAPRQGEEEELESERSLIAHRAKIAETLLGVDQSLSSVLTGLSQSHRELSRIQDLLPEKITPLLEAADRAMVESQEVLEGMKALKGEVDGTRYNLETLENRLYALRTLSRKYQTEDLLSCLMAFKNEFSHLEQGEDHLGVLEAAVQTAKAIYKEKADILSDSREKHAQALQTAIGQELPPLKLGHAKFHVQVRDLPEDNWGSQGKDQVEFYIQTNPGTPEGPLSAIASGGELSRLMLALKVVLGQSNAVPTLIFDEIESGTGGAVASAMGERLKALSQQNQILAITHSPQIASHGMQHLVVLKVMEENQTKTYVKNLSNEERYEEVARMLAGHEITEEARAAAKRLMGAL
jgi:DNA repair protein RecN (Recombination protein N)